MSMQIWNENGEQKLQCLVSRWVVDVSFRRDQAPGKWTNRMRIAENPGVLCISRGDKATTSFLILIVHPSTRKECYISQGLVSRLLSLSWTGSLSQRVRNAQEQCLIHILSRG